MSELSCPVQVAAHMSGLKKQVSDLEAMNSILISKVAFPTGLPRTVWLITITRTGVQMYA